MIKTLNLVSKIETRDRVSYTTIFNMDEKNEGYRDGPSFVTPL